MREKLIGYLATLGLIIAIVLVVTFVLGLKHIIEGNFKILVFSSGFLITCSLVMTMLGVLIEEFIKPIAHNRKVKKALKRPKKLNLYKKKLFPLSGIFNGLEYGIFHLKRPFSIPDFKLVIKYNGIKDKSRLTELNNKYTEYDWSYCFVLKEFGCDYHSYARTEMDKLINIINLEKINEQNANNMQ